MGYAKRT